MSWKDEQPTVKQLNYAHELAEQLGVEGRYVWVVTNWTRGELSDLINKLKQQLGYE